MVMIPKHAAVSLQDTTHPLSAQAGFVTGVRGEEARDGTAIDDDESEVTFVNVETGDLTVRVLPNDVLRVTGC
jgi:hypothetical protein